MRTYKITKKRDGQDAKVVNEFYLNTFSFAKREFQKMMLSGDIEPEYDGFQNKQKTIFSEDVYTWELHNSKNSEKL